MSTGKLIATGQRWVSELAVFSSFSLHHKPGKRNIIADTISHTSELKLLGRIQSCTETVPVKMVKALFDASDLISEN